jgi:hypothetical protein
VFTHWPGKVSDLKPAQQKKLKKRRYSDTPTSFDPIGAHEGASWFLIHNFNKAKEEDSWKDLSIV